VTLAVIVDTVSGRVLRRHRMSVFKWHRVALTGSCWYIRCLSCHVKTPTFSVITVFIVSVMEKSCDACGDEEYYFRSSSSATEEASV
jgi:NAD-dependent SIR2 family protein deacetylase